ncbi:hypothetical protein GEMRC1_010518 [Eukaryota sp. GEM-RC1]
MKPIIVFGSLNVDLTFSLPIFPCAGETIHSNSFKQSFGGKGANQAVACSRCQIDTTLIGAVGDDFFGKAYLDSLTQEERLTLEVTTISNTSTGLASILVDASGENMIVLSNGANTRLRASSINFNDLHICSDSIFLCQGECDPTTTLQLMSHAKSIGSYCVLNLAPYSSYFLSDNFSEIVDLLIVNETEGQSICIDKQIPSNSIDEIITSLSSLVSSFIITLGSKGAILSTEGVVYRIPPVPVDDVVSTVGAGDAFCAGVCVGLASGRSLNDAAQIGAAVAASKLSFEGAQSVPRTSLKTLESKIV